MTRTTPSTRCARAPGRRTAGEPRPLLAELESRSSRPAILYDRAALEGQLGERETAARCLRRILDESEYVPPYLEREVKPWVKKARQGLRRLGYDECASTSVPRPLRTPPPSCT